jgi:hypothetical protein
MKRVLYICLLVISFFPQQLRAQATWFDTSAQWTFYADWSWGKEGFETIQVSNDTVIGGKTYKNLTVLAEFNSGLKLSYKRQLRQDGNKIFARKLWGQQEFLMYDFSLDTGDTLYLLHNGLPHNNFGYKILSVDTLLINGSARLRQEVEWLNYPGAKSRFIEGIGHVETPYLSNGVWQNSFCYLFLDEPPTTHVDGQARQFCSYSASAGSYQATNASYCTTILHSNDTQETQIEVLPNPSSGHLQITISEEEGPYTLRLFDLLGRRLLEQKAIGDQTIELKFTGIAILEIQIGQKTIQKRIVFE